MKYIKIIQLKTELQSQECKQEPDNSVYVSSIYWNDILSIQTDITNFINTFQFSLKDNLCGNFLYKTYLKMLILN